MTRRKKYSKEFKLDAVGLIAEQGYTRAEAARSLGLNATMLGRWAKEFQSNDGQAFRGNGKLTPEQEENRKLKAQVKRLEMERDVLKNPRRHNVPARRNRNSGGASLYWSRSEGSGRQLFGGLTPLKNVAQGL